MNEHDELQEILSTSEENEPSDSKNGPIWVDQSKERSQWVVEGNDSFTATGQTTKTLPPGMFRLSVDDRGHLHFRKTPVLTDKIIDLKDPSSDEIITGIRKFWNSKKEFDRVGMLYKRGILLWGPAGSGKTVTVTILTRELVDAGGVVIFCDHPGLVSFALEQLRKVEPHRPLIVVFEDIEEIIHKYGEHTLLAVLDGEHQVANVVNIATTNYPERLGARIVNRPSRFDHVKKIGMPNDAAREAYFEAVVPHPFPTEQLRQWVDDTKGMSIAHLRELVVASICLSEPYEKTIERLKKMSFKKQSSNEFSSQAGIQPNGVTFAPSLPPGSKIFRKKPTIDNPAGL